MNEARRDLPSRVLMEIRPGADLRPATDLAASLARSFGSRVKGIFVEDANLLQLADLAVALEINVISRQLQSLDAKALPAEVARSLAAARRELAQLGRQLQCEVELQVERRSPALPDMDVQSNDIVLFSTPLEWDFDPASPAWIAVTRAMAIAIPGTRIPPQGGAVMAVLGTELSTRRTRNLLERIAAAEQAELKVSVSDDPLSALLDLIGWSSTRPSASPRLIIGEAGLLADPSARRLRSMIGRPGCPVLLINPEASISDKEPRSA